MISSKNSNDVNSDGNELLSNLSSSQMLSSAMHLLMGFPLEDKNSSGYRFSTLTNFTKSSYSTSTINSDVDDVTVAVTHRTTSEIVILTNIYDNKTHTNPNSTLNYHQDQSDIIDHRMLFIVFTSLILGFLILSTVIGNVFVIAAIIIERNLRTIGNYLVLSLAVADTLVACLVMPLGAVYEVAQGWTLGKELCDLWTSADVLCCTASILHLLAIAMVNNLSFQSNITLTNTFLLFALISFNFTYHLITIHQH